MSPWKDQLDDPIDEASIHRIWRGVESRRSVESRRPSLSWLMGGLAVAAAVVLALLVWDPAPSALTDVSGAALSEILEAETTLDDQSRISTSESATFQVLENTATVFTGLVSEGEFSFEVTPGGPRRWTVECGIAQVEVVGTAFAITRREDVVEVKVERGTVLVRSVHLAEGVTRLNANESIVVRRQQPQAEVEPEAEAVLPAPAEAPSEPRRPSVPSFTERVAAADAARAAGDAPQAERILLEALARHPRHPERSVAWFTVGRIRLGQRRNADALVALDRSLTEGLPAALREEAMIRRVEVLVGLGDLQGARRAGAEHAARFAGSSRRAEVSRLLPAD